MRTRILAIVMCCAALLSAPSISINGQQDPLPPVTPKPADEHAPPAVILNAPVAVYAPPSLEDAASKNDYIGFAALYNDMKRRGERVDAYSPLYDLWTWSLTNPTGAFYGADFHEKFTRAYPGFAKYIERYAIVDNAGNTFWPSSETRDFLLERAVDGQTTRVAISAPPIEPAVIVAREKATPASTTASAASPPVRRRIKKDGVVQQPVRTRPRTKSTPPPPATETALAPVKVRSGAAAASAAETKPAQAAEAAATPPAAAPPATAEPVMITPAPAENTTPLPPANVRPPGEQPARISGMFVLIALAILGIALFLMLMRSTAKENDMSVMPKPTLDEKPPAPVESITARRSGPVDVREIESRGSDAQPPRFPSSPDRSHRDADVRGLRR